MVVIVVRNKRHGAKGEYVGRPSPLGNPFPLEREADRDTVIDKYEAWLRQRVTSGDKKVVDELRRLRRLAEEREELVLTCWCAPRRCHADVVKRLIEEGV